MAEEIINSMVAPEQQGLDALNMSEKSARNADPLSNRRSIPSQNRRASTGSYPAVDRSLKNSVEKSDSAESSQNPVPHYLRASTGSCHDFCKYGRHHSSENKEKKPFRKRIPKPLPSDSYSVQILVSDGQKKEKVNSQGPSMETKVHSPYQKPSSHSKSYSSKPKSSLDKDKLMNHKPSNDAKTHLPDIPSPHSKSFRKPKLTSDAKTFAPKETGSSGNETLLSKIKPSHARKFPSADPPEIVKSVIFPSAAVKNSVNQGSSIDNKTSRTERKMTNVSQKHLSPVKSKAVKVKPSSSSDNSDFIHGKGRRNSIANAEIKVTAFEAPVKKVSVPTTATVSHKLSTNKRAQIGKEKSRNLKMESPSEEQNRIQMDMTKESNDEKVSEKTLHVIEAESENNVSESVPTTANVSHKLSTNKRAQISSEKSRNLKMESPSEERNRIQTDMTKESNDEKVSEKTLHVIEAESENNVSESVSVDHAVLSLPSPSSTESLSYTNSSSSSSSHEEDNAESDQSCDEADEVISGSDSQEIGNEADEVISGSDSLEIGNEADEVISGSDSQEIGKVQPVKENPNKTLRKGRVVLPEDKCRSPVKLKFRSGKVVDLQSDNNAPRRLRFRRARALSAEDRQGNSSRALKKAGANDETTGAEVSSEKVVLKHQDVQEKDAQGLFNNVIEETASKLVGSRKSKVKALVGAFGTVISLQESKPAT